MGLQVQHAGAIVARQIATLQAAGYVDAATQLLQTRVLTFNAQLRTFVMTHIHVTQSLGVGTFNQQVFLSAVNAKWPLNSLEGAYAVALTCLLFACFVVAATHALKATHHRATGGKDRVRLPALAALYPGGRCKRCRRICFCIIQTFAEFLQQAVIDARLESCLLPVVPNLESLRSGVLDCAGDSTGHYPPSAGAALYAVRGGSYHCAPAAAATEH